MSFAMSVDKNFEYSGSMIGMLANYKNFKNKQYFKMFIDITRFYKKSGKYVQKVDDNCTLEEFLKNSNSLNTLKIIILSQWLLQFGHLPKIKF